MDIEPIFSIRPERDFEEVSLRVFRFQYQNIPVYQSFCRLLGRGPKEVKHYLDIPFLPIEFFKSHRVSVSGKAEAIFESSGTTGQTKSKHYVHSLEAYEKSFRRCFERYIGPVKEYCILSLLPSYLEQKNASLVYMVNDLQEKSGHPQSGFYRWEFERLYEVLMALREQKQKVVLFGVAFALLDFSALGVLDYESLIVVETGGMKGRREEMIREELYQKLRNCFVSSKLYSEYGMTEILSQAYRAEGACFQFPPWATCLVSDLYDPFTRVGNGVRGRLHIIDLANIYACSFIATDDMGAKYDNGFEVFGRIGHADIRGCNLLYL